MCYWLRFVYECGHPHPFLEIDRECRPVWQEQIEQYKVAEGFPEGLECPPKGHSTTNKLLKGFCPECVQNYECRRNDLEKGTEQDKPQETQCKEEALDGDQGGKRAYKAAPREALNESPYRNEVPSVYKNPYAKQAPIEYKSPYSKQAHIEYKSPHAQQAPSEEHGKNRKQGPS